ncbi:MAG: thiopurine S-methyltransferase [Balneolaceae bacterium]
MEISYWQSRWRKQHIGFHMEQGYEGLKTHFHKLNLPAKSTVLVPLCGKSVDMIWLDEQNMNVIGVEVSEEAVLQFIDEHNHTCSKKNFAQFTIYSSGNFQLWCGDFFRLPAHKISGIDLIYDKAALVALPPKMRVRYADKILGLCSPDTNILLHHFEYSQNEMKGPPFSVSKKEIHNLFDHFFTIKTLEQNDLDISKYPKFQKRGLKTTFTERFLLLTPKQPFNKD